MVSRRAKFLAAALVPTAVGGYLAYSVFAAQAHPEKALAQAPMNTQVQVPASFIMAVDDSGSMTYHNQFPNEDGRACWPTSGGNRSFFDGDNLRSTGRCSYYYAYTSPRSGWTFLGIPPIDEFGFARSSDFNPAYFDPTVRYLPWARSDGTDYPDANTSDTRIHPEKPSPTINLAANLARANADSEFFLHAGMTLPEGTRFRRVEQCRNAGHQFPNGNSWTTLSSDYTVPNNAYTASNSNYKGCRVYIEYWPATFFTRFNGWDDPRPKLAGEDIYASVARQRVKNACGEGCHLWKYTIDSNDQEALQNFANWFSFYGNRNRAMIAGMTRSLASVNNMRVGYFTINSGRSGSSYSNYSDVQMWDMSSAPDRASLYEQLVDLPASGNTPNLPAVNHMGSQFRRTDDGAPVKLACQRNGGMLFTDGFSNVASTASAISGLGAPFDPTPANTMAAIASQYYFDTDDGESPLRTDLTAGQVPVPAGCAGADSVERRRLNCQSNLHMNFYGVTLGARGEIFDPDLDQDPYVLNPAWPSWSSGSRSTIDDIWHATVNTRGEFINARTPIDIVQAMRRILASVSSGASPSGAVAITGARIGSGSLVVTPRYEVTAESDGTDWYGDLEAEQITVNPSTGAVTLGPGGWRASERLPAPDARRIFFAKGASVQEFVSANLSLNDLCEKPAGSPAGMTLCAPATPGGQTLIEQMGFDIDDAVSYLRGDDTHEGTGAGHLRRRSASKIGDIVNSTPVISAPTDDYGYRSLGRPGGAGSINYGETYSDYLQAKKDRDYMVYVGANDGMLHAFNGSLGGNGGREVFAYIPATALGHMGNLLIPNDPTNENDQKFQHRYYVDGPVTVSDAHLGAGAGGGWATVLVGTSGAGGRSVFGLDVSNPTSFGASSRLWEINDMHENASVRANIGHVLGRPVIVPVRTTDGAVRWVAIFGNGYKSEAGKAVLFVVDIADGQVRMIEAVEPAGAGKPQGSNGLGNVAVVDRWGGPELDQGLRDGFADTVYAGDQHGAIWKFDLRQPNPTAPERPLFVSQSHSEDGRTFRQPIMGGIAAAVGPRGGVMLYFGTGSFSFVEDPEDESVQSLYAINDTTLGAVTETLDVSDLSQVPLNEDRTISAVLSVPPVGWYVNLPAGERMVGYPNIAGGTVFMPTYVPNVATTGCEGGGGNWLFGLNARTGAAGLSNVFERPGDELPAFEQGTASVELRTGGTAPVKDVGVVTLPRATSGVPDPAAPGVPADAPARSCWMAVIVAGADPMNLPYPCGRQSWRQLQ